MAPPLSAGLITILWSDDRVLRAAFSSLLTFKLFGALTKVLLRSISFVRMKASRWMGPGGGGPNFYTVLRPSTLQ